MRDFSSIGRTLTGVVLVAITMLFPLVVKAQAGFASDGLISSFCMTQNWDTPMMQDWLKKMPRQERMQIFSSLKFSSGVKRCLMKKKAAPVALCDKVIASSENFRAKNVVGGSAPSQNPTSEEESKILRALENSKCNSDGDPNEKLDWVPDDLNPSASTMALLERANKGDKTAQLQAVELFTNGKDVPPNAKRADYWLSHAAISGDANSQFELGWRYYVGKEPHQINFKQAIHFLTLAANQGNRNSMTLLARVYQEDEPDYGETKQRKDMVKAMGWLVKAANLGDPNAAASLARIHESGDQVPVDLVKAFFWYKKSAQNLSAESMLRLSEFYQTGDATAKDMKAAQQMRRNADALGVNGNTLHLIRYFPWQNMPQDAAGVASIQLKHARAGDVDAQLAIARRYFVGDGVKKDGMIATTWWRKAAMAGDPIGQRMLGASLRSGWDPTAKKSDSEGILWLQKAMAQGDTEAQVMLAYWHADGGAADNSKERKRNVLEGVRLMRQAAERGYRPEDTRERADKWEHSVDD